MQNMILLMNIKLFESSSVLVISQFLNNHNSAKSLKQMSLLTIVSAELVSAVSETVSISISKSRELYSHAVFIHKAVFCTA